MKKFILALSVFLFIFGCTQPAETEPGENITQVEGPPPSPCDSYSEGPQKVMCYAMESKNFSMCADIEGAFRESCVLALAELTDDINDVAYCSISEVEDYQKTCQALVVQDINSCFDRTTGMGMQAGIAVRDCVDLVSRKMKDPSSCDMHVTRSQDIYMICGEIQDCENQFTGTGAQANADSCRGNVEAAMQN